MYSNLASIWGTVLVQQSLKKYILYTSVGIPWVIHFIVIISLSYSGSECTVT